MVIYPFITSKSFVICIKLYFFRDNNNPDYEIPYPRGVGLMDGAKTMHASTVFRPNDYLPILPKNAKNELVYQEDDDIWELRSDDKVLNK